MQSKCLTVKCIDHRSRFIAVSTTYTRQELLYMMYFTILEQNSTSTTDKCRHAKTVRRTDTC